MSKSMKKNPFFSYAGCHSEKKDKKSWHSRWRSHERQAFRKLSIETIDTHQTILRNQVSSTWMMGKDGRYYWPISEQNQIAQILAQRKGKTQAELQKIKARLLHRWRGK